MQTKSIWYAPEFVASWFNRLGNCHHFVKPGVLIDQLVCMHCYSLLYLITPITRLRTLICFGRKRCLSQANVHCRLCILIYSFVTWSCETTYATFCFLWNVVIQVYIASFINYICSHFVLSFSIKPLSI